MRRERRIDKQWRIQERGRGGGAKKMFWDIDRAPYLRVLFVDQTETRRAEKNFLGDWRPPYLRVWMTGPPSLSECLDPPLIRNRIWERKTRREGQMGRSKKMRRRKRQIEEINKTEEQRELRKGTELPQCTNCIQ